MGILDRSIRANCERLVFIWRLGGDLLDNFSQDGIRSRTILGFRALPPWRNDRSFVSCDDDNLGFGADIQDMSIPSQNTNAEQAEDTKPDNVLS